MEGVSETELGWALRTNSAHTALLLLQFLDRGLN